MDPNDSWSSGLIWDRRGWCPNVEFETILGFFYRITSNPGQFNVRRFELETSRRLFDCLQCFPPLDHRISSSKPQTSYRRCSVRNPKVGFDLFPQYFEEDTFNLPRCCWHYWSNTRISIRILFKFVSERKARRWTWRGRTWGYTSATTWRLISIKENKSHINITKDTS